MSISWGSKPFQCLRVRHFLTADQHAGPASPSLSMCTAPVKDWGLVPRALHIWILDSKSTMWILLTPRWERIPELRVIICNEPNPKSPAKAAVTSEGAQTQIQTSVTYPSSTGCACNIHTTPVPGDKSKPQTCWCPSCAWFTETGLQAFPITTGCTTGMAGSKGHDCFLLQCASMFLLIFNTVNKSKARFDIYAKAVSLQSGNDYRNLWIPPSHWSSPYPFLCQYLQFCSYFLLLNLTMGNAKITHLLNFSCRIWINTIYNIFMSLSVSTAVRKRTKQKQILKQRGETMVRTSLLQSFPACCVFIDTYLSVSRISYCFSIYSIYSKYIYSWMKAMRYIREI